MSTSLQCDIVVSMLRIEFGDLWTCRPCKGGRVVHIQTPFSTPTNKFVSIYVEFRNDEWIVSDGGFLSDSDNAYQYAEYSDLEKAKSIIDFLADEYNVLETIAAGTSFYYMKTANKALLASRVSDVAAFIASAVSALHCSCVLDVSKERNPLFHSIANDFLKVHVAGVETNCKYYGIDHRFHARKKLPNLKDIVVSYVTGTTRPNLEKQLTQSIVYTEMLWKGHRTAIQKTVTLIDNDAVGYRDLEQKELRSMLTEKSRGTEPILWKDREMLVDMLNGKING